MTIRAVVFDLDYTLAVVSRARQEILDAATEAVGAPPLTRGDYLDVHSRHLDVESRVPIFAEMLDEAGSDVDPEALAAAYQETILDSLEPVDGAEEVVRSLREEYPVGLLTNGPVAAQRGKIETLGWGELFDAIAVTGDLEAGKPDERAFKAVLESLAVDPGETVYVGDDVDADIHGAKDAGMYAVQVLFPDGPDPDPRADAHVDRAELREALPAAINSLSRPRR